MDYLDKNILPPFDEASPRKVTLVLGDVLEHNPVELIKDWNSDPDKTLIA